MRLKSVHVTNYRSIVDSGPVAVDDICCLVGKNESGKTSFLTAVELLNPAIGDRQIDIVRDYPAWLLADGERAMADGDGNGRTGFGNRSDGHQCRLVNQREVG